MNIEKASIMDKIKSFKHGKQIYYHFDNICVIDTEVFSEIPELTSDYLKNKYMVDAEPSVDYYPLGEELLLTIPLLCYIIRNEILGEEVFDKSEKNQTLSKLYLIYEDLIEFLIPKPN